MRKSAFIYISILLIVFCSCHKTNHKQILSEAENIVDHYPDSALVLLNKIILPKSLSQSDLASYGFIKGQAHSKNDRSLIDDSVLVHSLTYYKAKQDTSKVFILYGLTSDYYFANKDYKNTYRTLDEAIELAKAINDSAEIARFYEIKARKLLITDISSEDAKINFQNSLQYKQTAMPNYMLGLWFAGKDSITYFMNKSIEIALQNKDTLMATHYLRNYGQVLYGWANYDDALKKLYQAIALSPNNIMSPLVASEIHLQLGKIDSADYYVNKAQKNIDHLRSLGYDISTTAENAVALIHAIINYSRHGYYYHKQIDLYNDGIHYTISNQRKILQAEQQARNNLERENMQLTIDRQQSQLWLMAALVFILIVSTIIVIYNRKRKQKLLEAHENIDTLNRLLREANETPGEEKNNHLFKKALLQQLGLIRLVASVPTSANQELLRQMSRISSKDTPTDTLLAWDDLYPVIDSLYNNFYSKLNKRYGDILTEKEIQLCCLLCADFSTKEINVVTRQSIPTIYQRKTTIRKKLGIEEKEDILSFLEQQFQP